MSTVDWVTVEHRGCREGRFRNMFLGWEVAKSSCLSRTPGYLSSDLLPGARGQGKSQPGGLGFQSDLESKWNRKLLTREDLWQGRPLDLLFPANKSRTERLPSLASPREWGWGQLEEEPGGGLIAQGVEDMGFGHPEGFAYCMPQAGLQFSFLIFSFSRI